MKIYTYEVIIGLARGDGPIEQTYQGLFSTTIPGQLGLDGVVLYARSDADTETAFFYDYMPVESIHLLGTSELIGTDKVTQSHDSVKVWLIGDTGKTERVI